MFGLVAASVGRRDLRCRLFDAAADRVDQQRDVRLAHALVVEQQVPQFPTALRIVGGVVEAELFEQAPFAPAGSALVMVRADDVHLHFARRVAAEPRTILHEDDLRAVAGRGDRGQHARHAAAGDEHVALELDERHVRLVRSGLAIAAGRRDRIELATIVACRMLRLRRSPVTMVPSANTKRL